MVELVNKVVTVSLGELLAFGQGKHHILTQPKSVQARRIKKR